MSQSELQFLHELCDELRAGVNEISSVKASLLQQQSSSPAHATILSHRPVSPSKSASRWSGPAPLWKTAPLTNLAASEYAVQTSGSKRSLHLPPIQKQPSSPPLQARKAAEQAERIAAKHSAGAVAAEAPKGAAVKAATFPSRSQDKQESRAVPKLELGQLDVLQATPGKCTRNTFGSIPVDIEIECRHMNRTGSATCSVLSLTDCLCLKHLSAQQG